MTQPILTDDHLAAANAVQQACALAQELIDKCKAIGMPVDEYEAAIKQHCAVATGIKTQFFPGR